MAVYGRVVTVTPVFSQPGAPSYSARGIYDVEESDVVGENGQIFSDHTKILDILESDWAGSVLPVQHDLIDIPADPNAGEALGMFEVLDAVENGGGETTLKLRKWEPALP